MLKCIFWIIEKTKSAISIIQQQQAKVTNARHTEELIAEEEAEVKQDA